MFEGQHSAIIEPDRWDQIQSQLTAGAAKHRQRKTAKQTSLLCGKLFDETGDRLTPSHTKTRRGTRLRYYVSHRLIKQSGEENLDGWRLPAQELETKVAEILRGYLNKPSFYTNTLTDLSADEVKHCRDKVLSLAKADTKEILNIVKRIEIAPGKLHVEASAEKLVASLNVPLEDIDQDTLTISTSFQLRKRGVETKLILADVPTGLDPALITNIAKANKWYGMVKDGETFSAIAKSQNTSSGRIQKMIGLAFLAPDILRNVLNGKQPLGLTSDWCMRHVIPSNWNAQRVLFATL